MKNPAYPFCGRPGRAAARPYHIGPGRDALPRVRGALDGFMSQPCNRKTLVSNGRRWIPRVGLQFKEKIVAADAALRRDDWQRAQASGGAPGRERRNVGPILEIGRGAGDVRKSKAARRQNGFDHFHGLIHLLAEVPLP